SRGKREENTKAVGRDMGQRGGEAVIPSLASRKMQHAVDKAVYALRNRIERFFNRAQELTSRRHPKGQADRELCSLRAAGVHSHLDQVCPHDLEHRRLAMYGIDFGAASQFAAAN